ncbi:MAG: hypothetical protein ABI699_06740 [Caldimonas sp.]
MKRLIVAITGGASGSVYGVGLLEVMRSVSDWLIYGKINSATV